MITREYLLDKSGMWVSALCAIHCITMPALVSVSVFGGAALMHSERVENTILMVSAVVAVSSLLPSYFRHHQRVLPLLFLLTGFVLIAFSRVMVEVNEPAFAASGASLIACAHFMNYRFCKQTSK